MPQLADRIEPTPHSGPEEPPQHQPGHLGLHKPQGPLAVRIHPGLPKAPEEPGAPGGEDPRQEHGTVPGPVVTMVNHDRG